MVEVLRTMTGFSWAMTLLGARQLGNLLLADADRTAVAFDAVTDAAREGLGNGLERVLETGERLQSKAVNRLFDVMDPDPVALSLALLEPSAEALKALPGQRCSAQELANKVRAFNDFQYAESRVPADGLPLAARIERAAAQGPYHRLWAWEGLGFAHAERAWRGPEPPDALLRGAAWPREAMIPLHTGMGTSLAMRGLGAIDTRGGDGALRGALERFIARCETHAAPDCSPMAFEALGLVVRNLHPHLLQRVDRLLATIDRELSGYYWHGVGRALYFLPSHLPPGSGAWRRALGKTRAEPPHEAGRGNALAGFVWALTLVNIRHPEVLESFLRCHAGGDSDRRALAHGTSAALVVWTSSNGREATLERFLDHRPASSAAEEWQRLVKEPGETALRSCPADEREKTLATLFRYQPTPEARPPRGGSGGEGRPPDVGRRGCARCGDAALPAFVRGLDGWAGRALQALSRAGPDTKDRPTKR